MKRTHHRELKLDGAFAPTRGKRVGERMPFVTAYRFCGRKVVSGSAHNELSHSNEFCVVASINNGQTWRNGVLKEGSKP